MVSEYRGIASQIVQSLSRKTGPVVLGSHILEYVDRTLKVVTRIKVYDIAELLALLTQERGELGKTTLSLLPCQMICVQDTAVDIGSGDYTHGNRSVT